jgi:hypothetical protein
VFLQALQPDVEMGLLGIVKKPLIAAASLGIVELVVVTVEDARIPSTVMILLVCVFIKYYVFCFSCICSARLLGTTNMLKWVHTTYKHQNDLLYACMHRNQHC